MDLSIVVPSIRHRILPRLLESIPAALGDKTWELIIVSPSFDDVFVDEFAQYRSRTPNMVRASLLEDSGSPARCLQRAVAEHVHAPIFTWLTDDGILSPDVLGQCVELLKSKKINDGVIVKYTEKGPGTFTGACDEYYISKNHGANNQPGIPGHYKIAPVGMFWTKYWRLMGGIDSVNFDHVNMNAHQFAYRLQDDGGELHYSPDVVMYCDSDNWGADHRVLDESYQLKDLPNFIELYKDDSRRGPIELDNWKRSEEVWRRFK